MVAVRVAVAPSQKLVVLDEILTAGSRTTVIEIRFDIAGGQVLLEQLVYRALY